MNIEDVFIKKVELDDDFSYKDLYNDDRGASFKEQNKTLISKAILKKLITVEKFVLAENVQDELSEITEVKGIERSFIQRLKNYHSEPDYIIAPLIYLLKRLDPDFTLSYKGNTFKIISNLLEVDLCPRIDGKNAEPRIYFHEEKIAITSSNDNVENLADIIAVKGVKVFIISTDDLSNVIYAYKVNRNDRYFEIAEKYKDIVRAELFDEIGKFVN
ncbi:hypothetical protein BKP37_08805 [Anaerobacillus alkalilacustris]|uniref:Uncharacterized protein n=1 Tax=Anaerobacillus alkalilacustris TaxID=393763 RepID=A0A1S2LPG8_9BACI|nr:hypothetical protein BKP37_08805 [Anaerobacillus alkalilacustris]